MNPHELLKHTYASAEPLDGFSARVLKAAQDTQRKKQHNRLPLTALIAAVLLVSFTVTAFATGTLRDWLSGSVDTGNGEALTTVETGSLQLERNASGIHAKYGQFLCVGRFLYLEVEITKDDGTEVTESDMYDFSFDSMQAYGLTLDYDEPYQHGTYAVDGEGFTGSYERLDDESLPGYARYTLSWTLSRHDYAGKTLHVQLWEPYEWEHLPDGTMRAINGHSRQLLAESVILRQTPADESVYHFDNGDEVRICAFGAEIQGKRFITIANDCFQAAYQRGNPIGWDSCGVLLGDGTKVPFNTNVNAGLWPELTSAEHWSAAPFSATVDPEQAAAIYIGDELLPLMR